ncbi:hypothetical protein CPC08DRAFT_768064 [Agrocybe pediades]|nr:hypothetical protein CPC08DRAFT_768064 [Agrocybe pediades]
MQLVEAVVSALAALATWRTPAWPKASHNSSDPSPLVNILAFTKFRAIDVQASACLCAPHTVHPSSFLPRPDNVRISPNHTTVLPLHFLVQKEHAESFMSLPTTMSAIKQH